MGILSSIGYVTVTPIRTLRYKTASPAMKGRIIKLGIICRKSWMFFPPLMMYQYIRQIVNGLIPQQKDNEMYTNELFFKNSNSDDAKAFYEPHKPKGNRNWKVQHDIALLSAAANNRLK